LNNNLSVRVLLRPGPELQNTLTPYSPSVEEMETKYPWAGIGLGFNCCGCVFEKCPGNGYRCLRTH